MHPQQAIFIHIAKTGGTSIVEYVRRRLPPEQVTSHGEFLDVADNPPLPPQHVRGKRFVSGHFGHAYVKDYLEGAFSFTILRDPLQRVLSFYRFCLHDEMQRRFPVARAAAGLSLNEFMVSTLPEVCEALDSQQTWQLATSYRQVDREDGGLAGGREALALARQHLGELSFVGFTEDFANAFRTIIPAIGLPLPTARVPRQLQTADPVTADQLHPDVLAQLRERLALDYALYDDARARFGR